MGMLTELQLMLETEMDFSALMEYLEARWSEDEEVLDESPASEKE